MSLVEHVHATYTYYRRVRVLSYHLAELLPKNARVLDVGCGDGLVANLVKQKRPDVDISGVDVLVRSQTYLPIDKFNGQKIPHADNSFDVVTFVDVLHHTEDPLVLLREAARVAHKAVLIKDHTQDGLLSGPTLRFMDRVGNARHGVPLPFNYWSKQRWLETFQALNLTVGEWKKDLQLYPQPASWLFDRSLHFIARLDLG